jgi:hypothetical protein
MPGGRCRTAGQVQFATLGYRGWFSHERPHLTCRYVPSAEPEVAYYCRCSGLNEAG